MHPHRVRGAGSAGRAARDDHDEIAGLASVVFQQRVVHLFEHLVSVVHKRHQERLNTPRQRELAAYRLFRSEGEQRQVAVQPSEPA